MAKGLRFMNKLIDFALAYPDLAPERVIIIDMKQDTWENIMTRARIELIRAINSERPESAKELARLLGRPVESVSRDLNVLKNYGILELVRVGRSKRPEVDKDVLMMPLKS